MAHASFDGLRVLSLESRRAVEVAKLIRTYSGEPFVVPAMREIPLESNHQALAFAEDLLAQKIDLVIFLTGVGVRALLDIVQTKHDREQFLAALRTVKVVARGPKPVAALRDLQVPIVTTAADPSTWRELMTALDAQFGDGLRTMRVAVQEYGASNPELLSKLTERCAQVTKVPVYQWALPEDVQPLREAVLSIANGSVDVVLFMAAVQVIHLFEVAEEMNFREELSSGLRSTVVVSIGPATSEELAHHGMTPDFEPSRPKMGFVVHEAAQYAGKILEQKKKGLANS
jgi:uroporphyrinogen-III synthase